MIELEQIKKAFSQKEVLCGLDLKINEGEVLAVIGPSGSGKTTLLRCINFLERADSGKIRVGDYHAVDIPTASKEEILQIRRRTAMVFQNYCLFKNKTAIENIMEGPVVVKKESATEVKNRAETLLRIVGLSGKEGRYPHQLSGGEQQRVGIARALAMNPDIILFDEPTSSLDPELVGEVLEVIRKVAREGRTMIIVTHEIRFAQEIADRIIFLDEGRIIEEGTPNEILIHPQQQRTKQFLNRIIER